MAMKLPPMSKTYTSGSSISSPFIEVNRLDTIGNSILFQTTVGAGMQEIPDYGFGKIGVVRCLDLDDTALFVEFNVDAIGEFHIVFTPREECLAFHNLHSLEMFVEK